MNQTELTANQKWEKVEEFFAQNFTSGEIPDLDTILFLIGVQELGKGKRRFKKDDKVNLLHIAVCRVLEPFGYYRFEGLDKDGWPQFEFLEPLPELKPNEQTLLMKQAIIQYFEDREMF
jgi:sensor domain CHASE-containing protein